MTRDQLMTGVWHLHRDRDLAVIIALAAAAASADRLHGTAVGIGKRVGN